MASCNDDMAELGPAPKSETNSPPRPAPKRFRASVVIGHAASTLVFEGKTRVGIDRRAILATIERRLSSKWTLQVAAGGIVAGTLKVDQDRYFFGPGLSAGVTASYRVLDGRGRMPFLLFAGTLAFAGATTQSEKGKSPAVSYFAGDLRLGAVVGKTFFQALSPYAVGRVFGGPISWQLKGQNITGTDAYHFQLGAGLAVAMPFGLDAFVEGVPFGEKALSTGLGLSF
jgi:hypothetical protein